MLALQLLKFFIKHYVSHFLFWMVAIISYFYVFVNTSSTYKITDYLLQTAFNLLLFYWNAGFVISWFKRKHKLWLYIFVLVILIPTAALFKEGIVVGLKWFFDFDIVHTESWRVAFSQSYITSIFIIASSIYRIIADWIRNDKIQLELRNEKTLAELMHLKAQVNPHFLFNTLNNLYYLCTKKDDIAPEMIMKLSGLMRYVVNVGSKDIVALQEELKHLESYIELEKLRLRDPGCIDYKVHGLCENQQIAPLILLPFVENAFKHSKELIEEGIQIHISLEGNEIHLQVSNRFNSMEHEIRNGVGLDNVKRRLELVYPHLYQLEISSQSGIFNVNLKIKLNDLKVYSH